MTVKRRLLPKNAPRGALVALEYFLTHDKKTAAAWSFFCLSREDHLPLFTEQRERLAAQVGKPVTYVSAIMAALRFFDLSTEDAEFASKWHTNRLRIYKPQRDEWDALSGLIGQLSEAHVRRVHDPAHQEGLSDDEIKSSESFIERFERDAGKTLTEFAASFGLTWDQVYLMWVRESLIHATATTASALRLWAMSPHDSELMASAYRLVPQSEKA